MIKIQSFINKRKWPENYKETILKFVHDSDEFNEMQSDFIKNGFLEKERVLASAKTATGKTLLAALGILKRLKKGECSFIYLAPYGSLKEQKFEEFSKRFESIEINIGKDYDGLKKLKDGQVQLVITDFSTFDRFLRMQVDFELASFYVFDEIDVLGSSYFGPSVEGSIARLLRKGNFNLLAISATIPSDNKLKDWLNADFFQSEYQLIVPQEEIIIVENKHKEICNFFLNDERTKNKSILVMIYHKKRVMNYAKEIASILKPKGIKCLKDDDPLIKDIIGDRQNTIMIKNLRESLKYEVAFHHADLPTDIKNKLINYYNDEKLKILVCTPTLLRGVNLKTRTVILPYTTYYNVNLGLSLSIPFHDYVQFKGRAGRPGLETEAYMFIFCENDKKKKECEKIYLNGELKGLKSGFIDENNSLRYPELDKQILFETQFKPIELKSLLENFSKYYYAVGIRRPERIEERITKRIRNLDDIGLLDYDIYDNLIPTKFGKEYLKVFEPQNISIKDIDSLIKLSLRIINDEIPFDDRFHFKIINEVLQILSYSIYISIDARGAKRAPIEEKIRVILKKKCGIHTEEIKSRHITLVCLIEHLIHISLEDLDEKYKIDSTRLETVIKPLVEKYIKALIRIIKFVIDNKDNEKYEDIEIGDNFANLSIEKITQFLEYLRLRIRYGVKFELIPIVTIKNIGNYRAISLYNSLNNRFKEKDYIDWQVLSKIEKELKSTDITGWGKKLINNLYENLESIEAMDKKVKLILGEFNLDYNIKK